jgi:hypothetical protein
MKCYCIETDDKFTFCVENVEEKYIDNVEHAWFKKVGNKYIKEYPNTIDDKDIIKNNFSRLGESMFKSEGKWKETLKHIAEKCNGNNIEWYIIGSISEAILGVEVISHDIDFITHTKDFYKLKDLFIDNMVEPFVDNQGTWVVQYFGRLCVNNIMVDVAADIKMDKENNKYDNVLWEGYTVNIEPIHKRYETEKQRNRIERMKLIEEYLNKKE